MDEKLYIAIATSGRGELLGRTLASLAQCRKPPQLAGTYVIENGPPGDAKHLVRSASAELKPVYLYEREGNKSKALNRLLEEIDDGLIYFLDDDVRLDGETLCQYEGVLRNKPVRQFFGGPVAVDYEQPPADWLRPYLPHSVRGWSLGDQPCEVGDPIFLGANWAAFAGDLRAMGGFNPHKGPGAASRSVGQESDMQRRLLDNGWRGLYLPGALLWHYVPAERCTPTWALDRVYRQGVRVGYDHAWADRHSALVPLRAVTQFAAAVSWFALASVLPLSNRFVKLRRVRWTQGYLRGWRTARSEQANSPSLPSPVVDQSVQSPAEAAATAHRQAA